jgi:putative ABC transport system permease protein
MSPMWKNNWKIALRHILKNKTSSAINISGLAIGMAACLLILQFVGFEFSYDQFHENENRIFRVVNDRYQNGKLVAHGTITYSGVARAMKEDFPDEIETYSRMEPFRSLLFILGDKKTDESGLAVDNSFLSIFSFPLLSGDRATALKEPNSVMLSEKLAKKFLVDGKTDPQEMMGKMIVIENDSLPYKVTGIFKNVAGNSHLQFDFLLSYLTLYSGGNGRWAEAEHNFTIEDFWHYILLKPGVDYKKLNAKFAGFSQRHFKGNKVSGSDEVFYLQPLAKAHFATDLQYDFVKKGNSATVWGLLIIAFFTIGIAWVNFINLATARSAERAKEVGVRKVIGALRFQLIRQFLFESLLINTIGLLLAVVLVYMVQPAYNHLLGFELSMDYLFTKGISGYAVMGGLAAVMLAGILISGFYPAFVLSSFKPIAVLKGKFSNTGKGILLRKALVVTQFAITIGLIVGSFVVYRQISFMSKKDLGFNMDKVLVVKPPFIGSWSNDNFFISLNSFKDEVKQLAAVKGITGSNRVPGLELGRALDVRRMDDQANNKHVVRNWGVNYDFNQLYQIKILAGRDFMKTDHRNNFMHIQSIILNQSAAKLLGFANPQDAIGKKVFAFDTARVVIGVTTDYHQKSLHHPVEPTMLIPVSGPNNSFSIRLSSRNLSQTIAAIGKKYEAFFPGNPYDYYFLDEQFNEQYKGDRLFSKVFSLFSGLAILIACLGLFGLSLYTITQRTKEIGVRKVLGASVQSIVLLLSKDFIKLVIVATIIAVPAAWWAMNTWLNDFAYRIGLAWWFFAAAALLALLIAMATISFHAIRSALANPVNSLRSE